VEKIVLVANTDWYLYNFRLSLARKLKAEGYQVLLASPKGPYVRLIMEAGFRWFDVPLSRRWALPLTELGTYLNLVRLYQQEAPSLVHHHTIKPNIYGTMAAKRCGVPGIINSVSGLGYIFIEHHALARLLSFFVRPFYRFAMRAPQVHVIFENTSDMRMFLEQDIVHRSQVSLVEGVGVDLNRYQPRDELPGEPVVILASRMIWDKGVGDFVKAAGLLREGGVDARFVLVGAPDPGNPTSIRERQLREWTRSGVVEWWGHQAEMHEILTRAHIVVLPSKSEGIPTVVLEASASGRPIVASDIPGCRIAVRDGVTGFLVPVGQPADLAEKIGVLLNDKSLRHEMGMQGRRWVESRFDQDRINLATIEVYNRVLGR
jgi:glycosyltransferase involved in cell wall biosynthesis